MKLQLQCRVFSAFSLTLSARQPANPTSLDVGPNSSLSLQSAKVLPLCNRISWRKLCIDETTRAKSTLHLSRKILPPPQQFTQKMLGELLSGSIHNYHVVHRASRSDIWRTTLICVMQGSAITYQKLWGNDLGVIT